jgi:ABC-type transport system substrate-binding protein
LTARSTQAALREIGVDVAIEGLDPRRFDQVLSRSPFDWDVALLGLGTTIDPHWSNRVWSASGSPNANRTGYANARVDALYEQAAHEFDRDRRRRLYQEVQHIVATDLPAVFLAFSIDCMFLNRRVHPNPPTRLGIAYRPEQWWLEDAV